MLALILITAFYHLVEIMRNMTAERWQLKSWKVAVILSVMLIPFSVAQSYAIVQGPGPSLLPGVMGSAMLEPLALIKTP